MSGVLYFFLYLYQNLKTMILIGLKKSKGTGSAVHDTDGNTVCVGGGYSTEFDIIKEGTADELKEFVKNERIKGAQAREKLSELEDNIEYDLSITEEKYMDLSIKYQKQMRILKYDKLLILQGIIV